MRRSFQIGGVLVGLLVSAACMAQTPSLTLIGIPPGSVGNFATGLSADGRTVVGYNRLTTGGDRAFKWTQDGGFDEFGTRPGVPTPTQATGVSADGSVVVGHSTTPIGVLRASAFRYSNGTYQTIPNPVGNDKSQAFGVSGDASVIVGSTGIVGQANHAMRWTQATGMRDLGVARPGDIGAWLTSVSRDGSTAIGISGGSTAAQFDPFIWTEANGWRQLPVPGGFGANYNAGPSGSNSTGRVIVGGIIPAVGPSAGLIWVDGTYSILPSLGNRWSMSTGAVNEDGSLITGAGRNLDTGQFSAALWIDRQTPVLLQDYLATLGVSVPPGLTLMTCGNISADGHTIVGLAQSGAIIQAFVATIPAPSVCVVGGFLSLAAARRRTKCGLA